MNDKRAVLYCEWCVLCLLFPAAEAGTPYGLRLGGYVGTNSFSNNNAAGSIHNKGGHNDLLLLI